MKSYTSEAYEAAADFADWHEGFSTKEQVEQLARAFDMFRYTMVSKLLNERKTVFQNSRMNEALQTALEKGELRMSRDGYLAGG